MTKASGGVPPVLAVDPGCAKPLYRQIYEGYRDAVLAGRLRAGERLPSTRALAAELGVSRLTVLNAFDQLLAEGYCEGRAGAGTFVAASLPEDLVVPGHGEDGRPSSGSGARPLAGGAIAELAGPSFPRRGSGAFSVAGIAAEHFPFRVWSTLLCRQARRLGPERVHYGSRLGLPSLRAAIAAYLRTARGVLCDPEQVVVVGGGSQQALDLASRVLLDAGSTVWVEDPGYWGARDALRMAGARLVPVPVDAEGLDVAAGIALAPQARAVFVTPSHQFPLGVTMSASRRLRLLDWARQAGGWIIEDDYNSEYRYESQPIAALQGLDRAVRRLRRALSPKGGSR